jgi:O-antigen/teichoic acid export membrane protein
MLSSFFGPAAAGFYTLGRTVMGLPSNLISASVGDVFYPRIAEAATRGEKLAPLLVRATLGLAAIGFVPFGVVVVFGPWLFGLVFGADWVVAGEYARWMAILFFIGFANRPCNVTLPVLSLLRFFLFFETSSICLRLAALLLGFYIYHSDVFAVAAFCIVGATLNLILISVVIIKSLKFDKKYEYYINFK